MLARYFEAMSEALVRHGGTVEKFIGDAVMAVFGIPTVREDDALRAVRAAAEMRTALAELNEQLELRWGVRLRARTGVNTGEVIAGDPSRGQGFVTGDAVNVAARLEQAARLGEILIGEHTLRARARRGAGRAGAAAGPQGEERAGAGLPADRRGRAGGGAGAGGSSSPLVGRERELAVLREAFERTVDGRSCELVTVLGPAGIGKSRLARDFADSLGRRPRSSPAAASPTARASRSGRCARWSRGSRASTTADSSEEAQAGIARLLPADDDTAIDRGARGRGARAVGGRRVTRGDLLGRAQAAGGGRRRRPLVVLFEDIHWGEPTFLELIEHLAGTIRGRPGPDRGRRPNRPARRQARTSRGVPAPRGSSSSR